MRGVAVSHTGLVRPGNEDGFIMDTDLGLLAVADGMGGHQAGEIASQIALKTLKEGLLSVRGKEPMPCLESAAALANEKVYSSSMTNYEWEGMGTTLTALWVVNDKGYLVHIGDSRAYLFRNGQLQHLTDDHSYVGELIRSGSLTFDEARRHPRRNILTRALGTERTVDIDSKELALIRGDLILLCTDGLYEVIPDSELVEILNRNLELRATTRELLDLALKRGGPDNITVVLALYE